MKNGRYESRDLLVAYLDAKKYGHAHEDLAGYYVPRYKALSQEFGIDRDAEPAMGREGYLPGLFQKAADRYLAISSPFEDYLEAPREIVELYRTHGARISAACHQARSAIFDLMLTIVEAMVGDGAKSFTLRELRDLTGFDDNRQPPDFDDYW